MSVRPPSFPELVAEASTVARARVADVRSGFVSTPEGQRVLKTFVTFTTLRPLKGAPPEQFTLEFLGGEAKGERWTVPGMPAFNAGEEEFIFSTDDKQAVCPLVGAMHGRYRVINDVALQRTYVARDNRAPLHQIEDVSLPPDTATTRALPDPSTALSPEEFERRILAEVLRPTISTNTR